MKRVVGLASPPCCRSPGGGCGSSTESTSSSSARLRQTGGPARPAGSSIVFAAASLKKSFTDIGEQFKTDNPGAEVEFSFAGSSDLVTQLTQGAPADVFASADTKNMDKAGTADLLAGRSGELRLQHADHRRRAGQPEEASPRSRT